MSQQNLYTLSLDSIKYVLGLIRDLASVSEAINNTNLADDKVFSNLYTKKLIDKCLEDANAEAQKLVGALTHLTCEETTVQPTLDNSSINVIYLYSADGNAPYQQYLKISDTKLVDLGSTSISLSNYLTATEIARDYVTKLNFDALKTEVDKKVNKTDIIDNLTSTDTDKPLSANQGKVLKDEVDLKANDNDVIKKTDIDTTIDNTSTDDKVPSAKAVFDRCIQGKRIDQSVVDTYGTEILKYPLGRWVITSDSIAKNFTDLPIRFSGHINIISISYNGNPWSNEYAYRVYSYVPYIGDSYVRKLESGSTAGVIIKDTGWKRICTTKVADVTKTKVSFINYFSGLSCYYEINNGICTVYFLGGALSLSSNVDGEIVGTLPKPKNIVYKSVCTWTSGAPVLFMVNTDGTLIVHAGTNVNGSSMYDTFSYPVAEE